MPWRECSVMEERLRFVARLLEGSTETKGGRRHTDESTVERGFR
jgi:hypothetical protein